MHPATNEPECVMGHLERFILSAPDAAVNKLMGSMSSWQLPALGKLNTRLRYWYYGYARRMWDFEAFVRRYVPRAATLLALLDGRNAMIYGGAVLRYFLRCPSVECPLDICTTLAAYWRLNRILEDDGYRLVHPLVVTGHSTQEAVGELLQQVGVVSDTWSLAADRSWSAEDHIGHNFQYRRKSKGKYVTINLHLVRCEPYRHVLGGSISPLTCYMTGYEAGAPFARTTFRHGLGFSLRNRRLLSAQDDPEYVIEAPEQTHVIKIIQGPPYSRKTFLSAETGSRRLGDSQCWTIPRVTYDPMRPPTPRQGSAFEVLDFNMVRDDRGTYMSIGEPFVWSSRYYYANRIEPEDRDDNLMYILRTACSCIKKDYRDRTKSSPHPLELPATMHTTHWEDLPSLIEHKPGQSEAFKAVAKKVKHLEVISVYHDVPDPLVFKAPVYVVEDGANRTEEIDLEQSHFPNGSISIPMCEYPVVGRPLPFVYRVFVDPGNLKPPPLNQAVAKAVQRPWLGNVVIARYARNNTPARLGYSHIARQEAEIIFGMVAIWLGKMWNDIYGH
ncbi:hypothetical protein DFP72DRAFT_846884 [Ephemerocybe angulata]|uniref:Uncharacterized protein n=1 Tax=Ephemerocybe angulata TaxID=980116 RepID=A0A8H6I1C2_9AGAR|nr:hypothetical protein DFP72DRAFT_846884 [Tulosesus angulatus]